MTSFKRILCLSFIIVQSINGFSQKTFKSFLPNGSLFIVDTSKVKSIKDYYTATGNKFLGVDELTDKDKTEVMYTPLTYKPVLFFAVDSLTAINAKKFVNAKKYQNSSSFNYDFKRMVDLEYNKTEVINMLGEPIDDIEKDGVYNVISYPGFSLQFIKSTDPGSTFLDSFTKYNFTGAKVSGIGIAGFEINLSDLNNDYVTGFKGVFYNFSKKKIKYLYITIAAINGVGDLVNKKVATGIGPILPGDSGSFDYNGLFFSKIIAKVKITAVKVQYFDGSVKLITGPALRNSFIEH
jgi:hypothetical protein